MKQRIKALFASSLLALNLIGMAMAGLLEDGQAAYQRGDYAEAMRLLRPLVERADAHAQTDLGLMYDNGRGVPKDYGQALAWFRKAAEQGYEAAQNDLGVMYALGQGVPQDYVQAYMRFNLAGSHASDAETRGKAIKNCDEAAAKTTPDQIAEAVWMASESKPKSSLEDGEAAYKRGDYATAFQLWRPLAHQGNADAQFRLGAMFASRPVSDDTQAAEYDAQAAAWYRKAADQGNAVAQFGLGAMYERGESVLQDYVQSHKWLSLATSNAILREVVLLKRDEVAAEMTPAQIAEAQRMAREWKPK
jgi:uncharacterized protein